MALPLLGVAITSVRPSSDLAAGNYFGWPSAFAWQNYVEVFTNSPIGQYILNSFKVTIPAVIGAVALVHDRLRARHLQVPLQPLDLLPFVAGNFVPAQILMIPVRNLTLQLGLYNSTSGLVLFHIAFQAGFCTLFMRNFIRALPRAS